MEKFAFAITSSNIALKDSSACAQEVSSILSISARLSSSHPQKPAALAKTEQRSGANSACRRWSFASTKTFAAFPSETCTDIGSQQSVFFSSRSLRSQLGFRHAENTDTTTVCAQKTYRVAILTGGRSGEYDVSIKTGEALKQALRNLGHAFLDVRLNREGGAIWSSTDGAVSGEGTVGKSLEAIIDYKPDCALIAMHGADGEDGRLQGAFDLLEIAYQGSGVMASAVALDKRATKLLAKASGVPVSEDVTMRRSADGELPPAAEWRRVASEFGLPVVIKTPKSGSSVGVELITTVDALIERGSLALANGEEYLLVEKYLNGKEFSVPVLEDSTGKIEVLPIIEIRPLNENSFFDFEAKYTAGGAEEIVPAPIDESLRSELADLATRAYTSLGCRTYSRIDFKLDSAGRPHLLEINTLPGMTATSMFPRACRAAGLTMEQLVQRLIESALRSAAAVAVVPTPVSA